jgi:DNA polymerase-4
MASIPHPADLVTTVCRDCLNEFTTALPACARCGSDRLLHHPELGRLSMAHIDCDAFYANIEKRDNPALKDKPVLVGGGGRRGVVSTACYVARKYGPRSAMPMFKALQMCPQAVVIKPDMAKYKRVSQQVRAIFEAATPLVEPLSLDEAFLDLAGTVRLFGRSPAATLAHIAREIERTIDITVSVGLSYNKFLAKMASDYKKPRGFFVIGRAEAVEFLHDQPIARLPGVGPSLADRLKVDGLFNIGDLQRRPETDLIFRYGDTGGHLARLARGQDRRRVTIDREAKSISAETTFEHDIGDVAELRRRLWSLSERVSERLKSHSLAGRTVTLKLKTTRFKTRTRNHSLSSPTQLAEVIFRTAEPLLISEMPRGPFRLLGVGVDVLSDAVPGDEVVPQLDLFASAPTEPQHAPRSAQVERAMDSVRAKFGRTAIRKGRADR